MHAQERRLCKATVWNAPTDPRVATGSPVQRPCRNISHAPQARATPCALGAAASSVDAPPPAAGRAVDVSRQRARAHGHEAAPAQLQARVVVAVLVRQLLPRHHHWQPRRRASAACRISQGRCVLATLQWEACNTAILLRQPQPR